jgi:hypothetical protein
MKQKTDMSWKLRPEKKVKLMERETRGREDKEEKEKKTHGNLRISTI